MTHAFQEGDVFVLAEGRGIPGILGEDDVDLGEVFQRADADARLRSGGLPVGDTLVDLAPRAGRDRRAEHEFMAATLVALKPRHVLQELVRLRHHLGDVCLFPL